MSLARPSNEPSPAAAAVTSRQQGATIHSKETLPLVANLDTRAVLVLDLDETLVHHPKRDPVAQPVGVNMFFVPIKGHGNLPVLERPWAREFLASVAEAYTLVVFTAGTEEYAQGVVKYLDPNGTLIHTHLSLHECTPVTWFGQPVGSGQTKNLEKVVTDLRRVLLIDNTPDCLDLQPRNGILVKSWYGDPKDTHLHDLERFLIHYMDMDDMRHVVEAWQL